MTVFCEYNFHIKHDLHIAVQYLKPQTWMLTLELEENKLIQC